MLQFFAVFSPTFDVMSADFLPVFKYCAKDQFF